MNPRPQQSDFQMLWNFCSGNSRNEFETEKKSNNVAEPDLPRDGTITPVDVIVPAQNTGLGPEKTSFFQALSNQNKIARGTSEIVNTTESICARKGVFAPADQTPVGKTKRIESSSCIKDADQFPVGKVGLPLNKEIKDTKTGEAFVCEPDSCDHDEIVKETIIIEKAETLKCYQNLEDDKDKLAEPDKLAKMKFKDVEILKRTEKDLELKAEDENGLKKEEEEDASMTNSYFPTDNKSPEKQSTASTCLTENCSKEGHATYKEKKDTHCSLLYDNTLSGVEEPEGSDDDEDWIDLVSDDGDTIETKLDNEFLVNHLIQIFI